MDITVTVEDVADAGEAIECAMVRHIDAHGELPLLLFVSPAGLAAIQHGTLGEATGEFKIVVVAHWRPSVTMTVA